jgi:hypothetical protein
MSRARLSRGTSAPASMAQDTAAATPAAHAMADSQMGGR